MAAFSGQRVSSWESSERGDGRDHAVVKPIRQFGRFGRDVGVQLPQIGHR
jgi:hypothetical protein